MGILLDDELAASPKSRATQFRELLIPEFFTRGKKASPRTGSTAWLDGLRGCAALCVVFMHLTVYTHDGLELCYGQKFHHNEEHNNSIAALPIIRLPFTGGHFSVMLFFVISGYVVPRRLVQLLHNHNGRQDFDDAVQSALVRRPVRLYLPVILSTLLTAVLWQILPFKPDSLPVKTNIIAELYSWVKETLLFSYFFRIGWLYTYYNIHTWTIPVELRGSLFLVIYLFVVKGFSTKRRIYATVVMIIYLSILTPGAQMACFFAGMLLCELDLVAAADSHMRFYWSDLSDWLHAKQRRGILTILLHVGLIVSLYLATQPADELNGKAIALGQCPGWITLSHLIPGCYWDAGSNYRWYWLFWASILMVAVIRELEWLRSIFETRFAQYLGRHSFALYLIHGPMIQNFSTPLFYMTAVKEAWSEEQRAKYGSIQNLLYDRSFFPFPKNGPFALEPNFLFCAFFSIPFFLYVAEIGTKLFDEPGISASRYVWQKWRTL